MNVHLFANLWLLGLTVLFCCILNPLTLWAIGQSVFPDQAAGSLMVKDGQGDRLAVHRPAVHSTGALLGRDPQRCPDRR